MATVQLLGYSYVKNVKLELLIDWPWTFRSMKVSLFYGPRRLSPQPKTIHLVLITFLSVYGLLRSSHLFLFLSFAFLNRLLMVTQLDWTCYSVTCGVRRRALWCRENLLNMKCILRPSLSSLEWKKRFFRLVLSVFFLFGHVFIVYVTHQSSFPAEPPFVPKRQDWGS